MNNPNFIARCKTACVLALLCVAQVCAAYANATPAAPSAHLQSLRELKEPSVVHRLPVIKAWKLAQGTKVLFVENHNLPMIDLKISFAAGSYQDGDTPGLAAMMLALFNEGSTLKDATALARGFDNLGVVMGNGISKEQSFFTLRTLSAREIADPAMALFTEMLAQPGLSVDAIRRVKYELGLLLKAEQETSYARALTRIHHALYADHPTLRSVYGSTASIESIEAAHLLAFYRRAYTAANAQITIVGDLTPEQAQRMSKALADALPAGPALPAPAVLVALANTDNTLHTEDDSTNTLIMMAQDAVPHQHPDTVALRIGNVVFNQILNEHLREQHSVTYGVSSDIAQVRGSAPWVIHLNTPSRYSLDTMAHIKTLFATFLRDGPTDEELDDIKKYLNKALPQLTSTNKEMRNELSIINRFNQPLSFDYKTREVQKMTPEQIKAAMNRHFKADGWVSLTSGPRVEQLPLPEISTPEAIAQNGCTSTN